MVIPLFIIIMEEILEVALSQGIASVIVVAIFLLLYKWLDNKKKSDSEKFINKIGDTLDELSKSLLELSNFVTDITKNVINKDKDKCKAAIEDSMYASAMRLVSFVSTTVINNHIDTNKENILSNIHNIVNSEYYSVFSTLSLYKINGVKPSDYMRKEWMSVIEKSIIEVIYNTVLTKEDKILTFSNKVNIKFSSYITYLSNNTLK